FHPAETQFAVHDLAEAAAIQQLESAWLPCCAHLTVSSPLIGYEYRRRYSLRLDPVAVLNVFPRREAPTAPPPDERRAKGPVRLYWFSQTLGADPGLETLIELLARGGRPCSLHLRARSCPAHQNRLRQHARTVGFGGQIEFLPFAPSSELVRLAAEYDIGVALELNEPFNRELCLSNKVFTYLLGGLPLLLSATRAHRAILPDLDAAACCIDLSDPRSAAATLADWSGSEATLHQARRAAWELGQTRYNWDVEQWRLVEAVQRGIEVEEPAAR
ncbi:MAG TPA: hypothetical protein VHF69_02825, partial [Candidatus Synoicihabitans sp.]|nr:hypothetical protein [Candidatus Synoicihabitans sp.]